MRADVYLVENNFATSRARAEALIVRGLVMVDGQVLQKKNKDIKDTSKVKLLGNLSYVSRGGDKLAGALDTLSLSVVAVTALDIGSSTGGFTDCLLQLGASEVYAVDVGSGQFDTKLANDSRVKVYEKTDIRNFQSDILFDIIVGDISFISWEYVVDDVVRLSHRGTKILLLIKPQFEVGKEYHKKGIVKDDALHKKVCDAVLTLFSQHGFKNLQIFESSLLGGDGNKEFFLFGVCK